MSSSDPEKSPSAKSSFAAESHTSTSVRGGDGAPARSGTSGRRSDFSAMAPRSSPPDESSTMGAAEAGPSSHGEGAYSSSGNGSIGAEERGIGAGGGAGTATAD